MKNEAALLSVIVDQNKLEGAELPSSQLLVATLKRSTVSNKMNAR
jgi:hypothetical protein